MSEPLLGLLLSLAGTIVLVAGIVLALLGHFPGTRTSSVEVGLALFIAGMTFLLVYGPPDTLKNLIADISG